MVKECVICIVGVGFRGLGVLERLVARTKSASANRIRVHLIDHSSEGPMQYDTRQPDYLLLNIVCGQVSLFPASGSVDGCILTTGPSLFEWARERRLRLGDDGLTVGLSGRQIEPDDFLPRRLLGEYLEWFRSWLVLQASASLEIVQHLTSATDLIPISDRFEVCLGDGKHILADFVFLTIGQPAPPSAGAGPTFSYPHALQPYPLPHQVAHVTSDATVAIAGLGLSALDVILSLTIGRGGRMDRRNGLRYMPSGREPRIIVFSRSGLPYRSRPALGGSLEYQAIAFTNDAIDALRLQRGVRLDYDRDVFPLLVTELRVAYRRAESIRENGIAAGERIISELRDAHSRHVLDGRLDELDRNGVRFDAQSAYAGALSDRLGNTGALGSAATYESWVYSWISSDLEEARLGIVGSPLKAALETCRQLRDTIRYAVDFGGLSDDSTEHFFGYHAETLNRVGVGPQKDRSEDLLALIDAGIVRIPLGPEPLVVWHEASRQYRLTSKWLQHAHQVEARWLFAARTPRLPRLTDDHGIVGGMARRRLLQRWRPDSPAIGGVSVDQSFHPISGEGSGQRRIWVLGLLCEGVTFYNGYVTSPGKFVRSQHDADNAVRELLSYIQ